jgi:hypothetical protein
LQSNSLWAEGGKALAEGLKGNQVITELNIGDNNLGRGGSGDPDTSGVTAIANVIQDMRAMTSLHVGTNKIPEKEMRELMAIAMSMDNMKILCEVPFKDKAITKLDLRRKNLGIEGARIVAEYLDGNRAISKFTFSGDDSFSKSVTMKTSMVDADFGWKFLGASGAIMVAAFLPKCT